MAICERCEATDTGPLDVPLGWSTAPGTADEDELQLLCPACTRRHVRDIEAKLDADWWA